MTVVDRFKVHLAAAGVVFTSSIIADGKLHRVHVDGDRKGTRNGWYILHADHPAAGAGGCHKRQIHEKWCDIAENDLSYADRERYRASIEQAKREREAKEERRRAECREEAARLWDEAEPCQGHAYLTKKGVPAPESLRVGSETGALLVPVRGPDKTLHGLQRIYPDGTKRFLVGTALSGNYCGIGDPTAGIIFIVEGPATGLTVLEAFPGTAVVFAFAAGNLRPVARNIRSMFPDAKIIIAGDNDQWTDGNPGLAAAQDAARAVGGRLCVPEYRDTSTRPTDFNDLATLEGLEAVREQLDAVLERAGDDATPPPEFEPPENPAPPPSDDDSPRRILDPAAPHTTAKHLVVDKYAKGEVRTLHHWQGYFRAWDGAAYQELSNDEIRANAYRYVDGAMTIVGEEFKPNRNKISDIIDALRAVANLPSRVGPPAWLTSEERPAPGKIIACQNGLLHLPTRRLFPADPSFFALNALKFDYVPDAADPAAWLEFLDQIWPGDPEPIGTLQEIFGYLLTADTTQQKIFLLVGPRRSGKGTIARILSELLGQGNVAGPTLASLAQPFGLATLIGKLAAVVSDARLSGRVDQASITERLLAISGEDHLSIPRKYAADYTAKLAARFLILTNELPRLADSSGALSSRFIILAMRESFLGREDPGLTLKLLKELPGILNWAVNGWQRLQSRGYFVQPKSGIESVQEFEDLSSPINAFIRDRCEVDPSAQIECAALYHEWRNWCEDQGRDHPGTLQTFGRDLRSAIPGVSMFRPRQADGPRLRLYCGVGLRSAMVRDHFNCTRKSKNQE